MLKRMRVTKSFKIVLDTGANSDSDSSSEDSARENPPAFRLHSVLLKNWKDEMLLNNSFDLSETDVKQAIRNEFSTTNQLHQVTVRFNCFLRVVNQFGPTPWQLEAARNKLELS